jgi:carbamoyl-phosphate synthase large subunit
VFFQLKADRKGTLKLLEAAPRIGGAMAVHRVLGVNFPLLSVYENEGGAVKISPNCNRVRIDRALVNRYRHDIDYSRVYVDFDDTLIVRGKVNAELVKMLYQSLNKGFKIILTTRTAGDIKAALKKYRLRDIFDEVISIKKDGSKADFIKPRKAIFIDDSFSERMTVAERHGIPTFDLSMIEMLMDERI